MTGTTKGTEFINITKKYQKRYDKLVDVRERILSEADAKDKTFTPYVEGVLDMFNETSKILEEL